MSRGFRVDANGPDESQEFASHCGHDFLFTFALRGQPAVPGVQPMLSLPGDVFDLRRHRRLTLSERGADGKLKPFATIMRWSTTVFGGDEPVKGEVLVVTRLAPGSICHVGYVDAKANPDGNALAQKIADEHARKFRCDTDKPIVLGNKGPGFSGRYGD